MAEVIWTLEAEARLHEIYDYIAAHNEPAARKVVNDIYVKAQMLSHHPRLGQRYELITDREVREVIYGNYRIPYEIRSEALIVILGIFHAAMDISKYLVWVQRTI